MATGDSYHWNADDDDDAVIAGAAGDFGAATMIQANDGYGGTNWEFKVGDLCVHVHFQGASRRVSTVRIKSFRCAERNSNIIRIHNSNDKGINLKSLSHYCAGGFPNHQAFLQNLHDAMQQAA